jgi:hypothetical protein
MQAAVFRGPNRITIEEVKFPSYSYYYNKEDNKEIVLKVNARVEYVHMIQGYIETDIQKLYRL